MCLSEIDPNYLYGRISGLRDEAWEFDFPELSFTQIGKDVPYLDQPN